MYKNFFKRILDLVVSILCIILLSPVFIVVMLMLFIVNRGNPFFLQGRPGKKARIFKIIKFKTMNDKKDSYGNLLPDVDRLTFIGRILRKTSLDEIPQMLNVIKGDMSLVGPRPLLPEYLPKYTDFQKRRHEVRPGITGLAQVRGRKQMLFSERFKIDVYYVDHLSLFLDVKIILLTIKTVLFSSNPEVYKLWGEDVDDI